MIAGFSVGGTRQLETLRGYALVVEHVWDNVNVALCQVKYDNLLYEVNYLLLESIWWAYTRKYIKPYRFVHSN